MFVPRCSSSVDVNEKYCHGAEDDKGGGKVVACLVAVFNIDVACTRETY